MKELWTRFLAWVKGFPWFLGVGSVVVGALVLIFLVKGKLYVWDYPIMGLFVLVVVFFVWKMAKKR